MTDHLTSPQELKPCPFCKRPPVKLLSLTLKLWFWESGFRVDCWGCGAEGPIRFTRAAAMAAWNQRPT